jgi:hypothetical protein
MVGVCAWTAAVVVSHALIGPVKLVSAQDAQPTKAQDEVRDGITEKAAAARLLAAMGPDTPVDTKVAQLIERLVLRDRAEVQAAVTALVLLGPPAVPAIIRRMDDRRDMPVRAVGFENRAVDAFEGVRWPGFVKVIDCLDLVLNDITGESFGQIDLMFAGDPDRPEYDSQRSAMVAGWQAYLARKATAPRAPGKSLPLAGPTEHAPSGSHRADLTAFDSWAAWILRCLRSLLLQDHTYTVSCA